MTACKFRLILACGRVDSWSYSLRNLISLCSETQTVMFCGLNVPQNCIIATFQSLWFCFHAFHQAVYLVYQFSKVLTSAWC